MAPPPSSPWRELDSGVPAGGDDGTPAPLHLPARSELADLHLAAPGADGAHVRPPAGADARTVARVRPLRPDDGELLDRVFAGMSAQSRYQRFHAPKPRLTSGERRYLMGVDGRDHVALVVLAPDGAPVALARCIRLRDEPRTGELAVEVIDAWQGRGLGTTLIAQLARRAAGVGIDRLLARVLDESRLGPSLRRRGWRPVERDGASWVLAADAWAVARAGGDPRVQVVPALDDAALPARPTAVRDDAVPPARPTAVRDHAVVAAWPSAPLARRVLPSSA